MVAGMVRWLTRSMRALPNSLLVAFALFALLPAWSLSFINVSDVVHVKDGSAAALLQALTYWLLPLAICATIVARSFWVLPLFLADCGGLVALALKVPTVDGFVVTKLAFLAVAVVTCLVIAQKDLLFPFMTRGNRFWRRAPRLFVNHQIVLWTEAEGERRCMLEDCSLTGMAVALPNEAASGVRKGSRAEVRIISRGVTAVVPMQLVWVRSVGEMTRLGLEATDSKRMLAAFLAVSDRGGRQGALGKSLERLWTVSAVRRTALILFGVSVAASFGMPACGVMAERPVVSNHRSTAAASGADASTEATAAVVSGDNSAAGWRQATLIDQAADVLHFSLNKNDDANLVIAAAGAFPGASIMLPKGSVKRAGTLSLRPGFNLNAPDLWSWLAVRPQAEVKTSYGSLEFSPDQVSKDPVTLTVRLPLTQPGAAGVASGADPKALVVLYRVVRGGRIVYGAMSPEHLRIRPSDAAFGLTEATPTGMVEFDLSTSLSGSVQLVELTAAPGQVDAERTVGDAATLDEPRHIALICATPTADLCNAQVAALRQSGHEVRVTAGTELQELVHGGVSLAGDETSDVVLLSQGPLEDGACLVGSGPTCTSFTDIHEALESAAPARFWLWNCPMPAALPSGVAAAECLSAGEDPAAGSRILQLLSDPLLGLYGGSDGTLTEDSLGRYLGQLGTDASASFAFDPALAAGGSLPAINSAGGGSHAAATTGASGSQDAGASDGGSSGGVTNGTGSGQSSGAGGSGGMTSGMATGSGQGGTGGGSGSPVTNGMTTGAGQSGSTDASSHGEDSGSLASTDSSTGGTGASSGDAGSSGAGADGGSAATTGGTTGSTDGDAFFIEPDEGEESDLPPPGDNVVSLAPAAVCKAPAPKPCAIPGAQRCNGDVREQRSCTVVDGEEKWSEWTTMQDCSDLFTFWAQQYNGTLYLRTFSSGKCINVVPQTLTSLACIAADAGPNTAPTCYYTKECQAAVRNPTSKSCPDYGGWGGEIPAINLIPIRNCK